MSSKRFRMRSDDAELDAASVRIGAEIAIPPHAPGVVRGDRTGRVVGIGRRREAGRDE